MDYAERQLRIVELERVVPTDTIPMAAMNSCVPPTPCLPCGTVSSATLFAARHPNSGVVFPAGRDVFHFYGTVGTSFPTSGSGLCSSNTAPAATEYVTGVTTAYIAGNSFSVTDFNSIPSGPFLVSQSDWTNHHDPVTNTPVFGVPTIGTMIFSGRN